ASLDAHFREPLAPTPAAADGLEKLEAHSAPKGPRFVPAEEEPGGQAMDELRIQLENNPRGVIICGPRDLDGGLRRALSAFGRRWVYPFFSDAASEARLGPSAQSLIPRYDLLLRRQRFVASQRRQLVLRFGGPRVSKVLQGWLDSSGAEVVSFTEGGAPVDPFHSARTFLEGSPVTFCDRLLGPAAGQRRRW